MRHPTDRHLPLGHDLEQRGLHLRGCAVDLVREHDVGEDRPELDVERLLRRPVDARAHEVGGNEVGRELQPGEAAAEDARDRLRGERLRETGRTFEQAVASCEPAHEEPFDHEILSHEHALRFEQRFLEHLFGARVSVHRFELLVRQALGNSQHRADVKVRSLS